MQAVALLLLVVKCYPLQTSLILWGPLQDYNCSNFRCCCCLRVLVLLAMALLLVFCPAASVVSAEGGCSAAAPSCCTWQGPLSGMPPAATVAGTEVSVCSKASAKDATAVQLLGKQGLFVAEARILLLAVNGHTSRCLCSTVWFECMCSVACGCTQWACLRGRCHQCLLRLVWHALQLYAGGVDAAVVVPQQPR